MTGRVLCWLLILWALATGGAAAQSLLELPYGLKWGDSPEKLISWASRHSLDVTISLPGDQPALRVLKIQARKGPIPGATESALEGRFLGGKLIEFTRHFDGADSTVDGVEARFQALKLKITTEQGPLVANQQQRSTDDQFSTRTQSYHREPVKGLFLMLVFTEVEDLLRKSKDARYSLVYRNDNLRQDIEKMLQAPPSPTDPR